MSLEQYCHTEKERAYTKAFEEHGPQWTMIAKMFDKKESTVRTTVGRVRARAAIQGFSPDDDMVHTAPATHVVKGVSTLYDDAGGVKQQWVKTDLKKQAIMESLRAMVDGMKEEIDPVAPVPMNKSEETNEDLLNMYTIADTHLGMLANREESGANYDLDKGEELLKEWFDSIIDKTPNASCCLINCLGDLLHQDSYFAETPQSKHRLDSDSRFPEIVRTTIRVMRYIIQKALTKHDEVNLVLTTGNHDMSSTVWLRELFEALYEHDPRVHVDTRQKIYLAVQFGDVMLAFHHGDRKKGVALPLLFATDYAEIWGETEYRYAHVGHLHHQEVKEYSGMIVEQHATLAAKDAYASWGGYRSTRKANCITYHRHYGEVGRVTVTPDMLGFD